MEAPIYGLLVASIYATRSDHELVFLPLKRSSFSRIEVKSALVNRKAGSFLLHLHNSFRLQVRIKKLNRLYFNADK